MSLLVRSYCGDLLDTTEKIVQVAEQAQTAKQTGNELVIVVSAMSSDAGKRACLDSGLTRYPQAAEVAEFRACYGDLVIVQLAMACSSRGMIPVTVTGKTAPMTLDGEHGFGSLTEPRLSMMRRALDRGAVILVGAVYGVDGRGNIVALESGGAGTVSFALAAELNAARCERYTDLLEAPTVYSGVAFEAGQA